MLGFIFLIAGMIIILLGSELFTNSVEWLGRKTGVGDNVVGSLLAAVGTALPETIIPIVAVALNSGSLDKLQMGQEIGIGAIIGSSFMLATLAFFVTGAAVFFFSVVRKRELVVQADPAGMKRDLLFFLIAYTVTISSTFITEGWLKVVFAIFLVCLYFIYVRLTIQNDEASDSDLKRLLFDPKRDSPNLLRVLLQMAVALALIIGGAQFFVTQLEDVAVMLAISPVILSLLITPFATELPEKFNSVIWVRAGKDTLALGNITGALVFQSCILPAVGILLTPWQLGITALVCSGIGFTSALIIYLQLHRTGKLNYKALLMSGVFYLIFVIFAIAAETTLL
jgi:cation:H+ antiporter